MDQYRVAITKEQAVAVLDVLEYEIESLNNMMFDSGADEGTVARRDDLREFRDTLEASMDNL